MKKGLIYLLLLVLGTATFSSCEDDDNDGYKRISSEYKNATLKLTFNGKELNDKTVEIQALNETTANLILKSLIPGESNLYLNALLHRRKLQYMYRITFETSVAQDCTRKVYCLLIRT